MIIDVLTVALALVEKVAFPLRTVLRKTAVDLRGGSVCLNSFGRFAKWISASIMPPPSLVSAR